MQHKRWLVPALIGVALAAGCGGEDNGTPAADETTTAAETTASEHEGAVQVELEVELEAVNDSGISGTAMLAQGEGDGIPTFTVDVTLDPVGDASHPAHIHDVTCAEYAEIKGFDAQLATVADTLTDVDAGKSTSSVGGELGERTTGEFSINVHEPASPFPAVACGDIPAHESP